MPRPSRLPILCVLLLVSALLPGRALARPPSPEDYLGRPIGTDFELADWKQVSGYADLLAERSPRVQVHRVGKTTGGHDLRILVISSEKNLARLSELKGFARQISDPRGLDQTAREAALKDGRTFLFISNNLHSTEIASPEMSMQLAYLLATSNDEPYRSARSELVVIIAPSVNPDGLDKVVQWYRSIKGTPYESARLPELYQWYAGHDNNRDWFIASLKETRIMTRQLYFEWFPQVYWDVHQQGRRTERLFLPPFRDPLNPNLDGAVMAGIGALGSRIRLDMTRRGFRGIAGGIKFDMWWNGGNRNVPVRHNMIGILTEAASANLASPVYVPPEQIRSPRELVPGNQPSNFMPEPWPGGWWRIGDIIRYELAVAESLLANLAREPRYWRELVMEAALRAAEEGIDEAPHAWLIPKDNPDLGAVRRLVDSLLLVAIDIEQATEAFVADEVEYPAGTLILRRAQPYGPFLKDLLEIQRYPGNRPPYDTTGWTLPLLMGIHRVEIARPFAAPARPVKDVNEALAEFERPDRPAYPWPHLDGEDSDSLEGVFALLEAGVPVVYDGDHASPRPGSWVVPRGAAPRARRVLRKRGLALQRGRVVGAKREGWRRGARRAPGMVEIDELPRVALYAPWAASMDEGWTRWVLDRLGVPYTRVRNETVRAGNLGDRFDVVILPSVSADLIHDGRPQGTVFPRFAGGLDPEGSMALHEFVRLGGTLVAFERAGDYVNELFALGLVDAADTDDREQGFSCPGAILRTLPDAGSPWTAGVRPSQPVFFADSRAYRPTPSPGGGDVVVPGAAGRIGEVGPAEILLGFPRARALLSGWIRKPEAIADAAAWLRVPVGDGQIHVFGIRPAYRSWSQSTFRLLVRAMLLPANTLSAAPGIEEQGGAVNRERGADRRRRRPRRERRQ